MNAVFLLSDCLKKTMLSLKSLSLMANGHDTPHVPVEEILINHIKSRHADSLCFEEMTISDLDYGEAFGIGIFDNPTG